MNLAAVDRMQAAIWNGLLGEPVELLDAADVVQWSGRAIQDTPEGVEAGGRLSYMESLTMLSFRRADRPDRLPKGSRLRWRGDVWTVDETDDRSDHTTVVTVFPAPVPLGGV